MNLTIEHIGEVVVVGVQGDHLDMGNAETFVDTISPTLETATNILLDMRQLQFVDSAGLGALMACRRLLSSSGGELTLCGMSKKVRSVFDISRMHRLFRIAASLEEAMPTTEN